MSEYLDLEYFLNYLLFINCNKNFNYITYLAENIYKLIPIDKKDYKYYIKYKYGDKFKNKRYNDISDISKKINSIKKNLDNAIYYVTYKIINNNIIPIDISFNIYSSFKILRKKTNEILYIVGLKSNKIYSSIFEYEFLYLSM